MFEATPGEELLHFSEPASRDPNPGIVIHSFPEYQLCWRGPEFADYQAARYFPVPRMSGTCIPTETDMEKFPPLPPIEEPAPPPPPPPLSVQSNLPVTVTKTIRAGMHNTGQTARARTSKVNLAAFKPHFAATEKT